MNLKEFKAAEEAKKQNLFIMAEDPLLIKVPRKALISFALVLAVLFILLMGICCILSGVLSPFFAPLWALLIAAYVRFLSVWKAYRYSRFLLTIFYIILLAGTYVVMYYLTILMR